ncbi:MAG: Ig-like domain-containing protein [Phycisphaerae bacterium]|jgi:hypothetical protein
MSLKDYVSGQGTTLEIQTGGTQSSPTYTDISDITISLGETLNEVLDTFQTLSSAISSTVKTAFDPEWTFSTKGNKSHAALMALMAVRWQTGSDAVLMVRITDTLTGDVITAPMTITGFAPTYETPTVVEVPWSMKPYEGAQVSVATSEAVAPTISTYSPADDAEGVSVIAPLVIEFDESVLRGIGDIKIYKTSDDSLVESINVQLSGIAIADDTVTVTRSVTLAAETAYYVLITAGAFTDLLGNDFAGIAVTTVWSFTTAA